MDVQGENQKDAKRSADDAEVSEPKRQHTLSAELPSADSSEVTKKAQPHSRWDVPPGEGGEKPPPEKSLIEETEYGKFLILELWGDNHKTILKRSLQVCDLHYDIIVKQLNEDSKWKATLFIKDKPVAHGEGVKPKKAKQAAIMNAVEKLKETCYTLKERQREVTGIVVTKALLQELAQLPHGDAGSALERLLGRPDLRQCDMQGAGPGSKRGKPIKVMSTIEFRQVAERLLQEYIALDTWDDLVLSNEFVDEEKQILREYAEKMDLKNKVFYRSKKIKYMTILKKVSFWNKANRIMSGWVSSRFELIPPHVAN
ncbi:uncharacterized protein LOC134537548 [Bacillus rossius redtenbacheri]|uniref:uncharacterized protein LOC134537548 n=1 Tax=Bacillus rossius redtenbacheri TaxID=93214 RepID=UPI002FDEF014